VPRDGNHADEIANEYSLAQLVAEYQRGELPERTFAILSYETAKLASGRVPAMPFKTVRVPQRGEDGNEWTELKKICTCSQCGQVVAEKYDPITGEPDMATAITPERMEQFIGTKRRFCLAPYRLQSANRAP
jgi:hypothetical protein